MRALLSSLLVLGWPLLAVADDMGYYPLKVGTMWTYKIVGQEQKFFVTAAKEEKVGERTCVRIEGRVGDELVASEHIAVLKDGVYRFKYSDQVVEPPLNFFKPAAKKGDTWKQVIKVGDATAAVQVEADVEDVKVPAGDYKDAKVVRIAATENKNTTKTTIWCAKGVGMVKQFIDLGDVKIALELEKFEPPKE